MYDKLISFLPRPGVSLLAFSSERRGQMGRLWRSSTKAVKYVPVLPFSSLLFLTFCRYWISFSFPFFSFPFYHELSLKDVLKRAKESLEIWKDGIIQDEREILAGVR